MALETLFGAFVTICFAMWLLIVWAIAGASKPAVRRNWRNLIREEGNRHEN